MLNEIRLINYRAFRCERIPLEPITVFIGPNGSGKSTVASALYSLSTIVRLGLSAAFPGGIFSFSNLQHFEPLTCGYRIPPIGIGISGEIAGMTVDYDLFFNRDFNSPTGFYIHYEGIRVRKGEETFHHVIGVPPEIDFDLPTRGDENWPAGIQNHPHQRECVFVALEKAGIESGFQHVLQHIRRYMQKMSKYQFSPSQTRIPCEPYDGSGRPPKLKSEGSNLAEVVQYFQEEQRGRLGDLKDWLKKYAEGGNRIVDLGVAIFQDKVILIFFEEGENRRSFEVRGPLVSDGYWVFTAFAFLAYGPTLPSIAFFEEPESHLHPHKLPILREIFGTMGSREGNKCQVLMSTHSPYFLDLFKETPESVLFLRNGKARRLTGIPDYERILSLYSLGEAWFSNVFEIGNPQ